MGTHAERAKAPPPRVERGVFTSKGQLVVPARLRRKFKIRPGTPVSFIEQDHAIVVQPMTDAYIESLKGSLKGGASAMKQLLEERRKDRF